MSPPAPSHPKVSWRWIYVVFQCCSHVLYLPCMQEQGVHHLHLPHTQKLARGGFMLYFNAVHMSSTSFACNSEPYTTSTSLTPKSELECHFSMPFTCPPPLSHATARWRWIFSPSAKPLSSQGCTAVSIDTRTALVRLLGQFWSHTCMQVCVPLGFLKPLPQPIKTHTLWCGYRFAWVRVWVALEYPRVTCDNL